MEGWIKDKPAQICGETVSDTTNFVQPLAMNLSVTFWGMPQEARMEPGVIAASDDDLSVKIRKLYRFAHEICFARW